MKNTTCKYLFAAAAAVVAALSTFSATAQNTSFTYQGLLTESGSPSAATNDFTFTLYDAASGGSTVGAVNQADDLVLTDGTFTVALDFGPGAFDGSDRWLEIGVRPGAETGAYTTLTPRQALNPTPYAIHAGSADIGPGVITSGMIAPGAVTSAKLDSGIGQWTASGGDIVLNSGNVGIGTTTPEAPMHIHNGSSGNPIDPHADLVIEDNDGHTHLQINSPDSHGAGVNFGRNGNGQDGGFIYQSDRRLAIRAGNGERMTVKSNGNVGIGTTSPSTKLVVDGKIQLYEGSQSLNAGLSTEVNGQLVLFGVNDSDRNRFGGSYNKDGFNGGFIRVDARLGGPTLQFYTREAGQTDPTLRMAVSPDGKVGIGTHSPKASLSVTGVNPQIDPGELGVHIGMIPYGDGSAASVTIAGGSEGAQLRFHEIGGENARPRLWYNSSTNNLVFEGAGLSKVSVPVLEIRGGADLVEGFDSSHDEVLEPGTVVVIDPDTPGSLMRSVETYDPKVAGVVSGANGVQPGIHLGQESVMDGDTKVAMTGRVYVKCSAENGTIRPGDRLTTASLPGHAMKATATGRCDGAVIGKAMSSLDEQDGLVLVLVNLQ